MKKRFYFVPNKDKHSMFTVLYEVKAYSYAEAKVFLKNSETHSRNDVRICGLWKNKDFKHNLHTAKTLFGDF